MTLQLQAPQEPEHIEPYEDFRYEAVDLFRYWINNNNVDVHTIIDAHGTEEFYTAFRPRDLFYELVRFTAPYGAEHLIYRDLIEFMGMVQDEFGNYLLDIPHPDGTPSTTCFAAHLDTADGSRVKPSITYDDIKLRDAGTNMVGTATNTLLGADDRAGVTVLVWLAMHHVPGRYIFFIGEEVGRVGSEAMASEFKDFPDNHFLTGVQRMICFDRTGYSSIINAQTGTECCSMAFVDALAKELNMLIPEAKFKADEWGSYTDSYSFIGTTIPELTNISIGYFGAHTVGETQNVLFLDLMAQACVSVAWDLLPTERNPADNKYIGGGYYGYGYGDDYVTRYPRALVVSSEPKTYPSRLMYLLLHTTKDGYVSSKEGEAIWLGFEEWYAIDSHKAGVLFKLIYSEGATSGTLDTYDIIKYIIMNQLPDDSKEWDWFSEYNYLAKIINQYAPDGTVIDLHHVGEWAILSTTYSSALDAIENGFFTTFITNGNWLIRFMLNGVDVFYMKTNQYVKGIYNHKWTARDIEFQMTRPEDTKDLLWVNNTTQILMARRKWLRENPPEQPAKESTKEFLKQLTCDSCGITQDKEFNPTMWKIYITGIEEVTCTHCHSIRTKKDAV